MFVCRSETESVMSDDVTHGEVFCETFNTFGRSLQCERFVLLRMKAAPLNLFRKEHCPKETNKIYFITKHVLTSHYTGHYNDIFSEFD